MLFLDLEEAKKNRDSAFNFVDSYKDACGVLEVCDYCLFRHEIPVTEKWLQDRDGIEEYLHKWGVYVNQNGNS